MDKTEKQKIRPSFQYALATLGALIVFVVLCLLVFKVPIIITLFLSWMLLTPFAMKLGYSISEVEETVYEMIKSAASMYALLLAIGCMVAIMAVRRHSPDSDVLGPQARHTQDVPLHRLSVLRNYRSAHRHLLGHDEHRRALQCLA